MVRCTVFGAPSHGQADCLPGHTATPFAARCLAEPAFLTRCPGPDIAVYLPGNTNDTEWPLPTCAVYHRPGGAAYESTLIETNKGERWFCSDQEALGAGWRPAKN